MPSLCTSQPRLRTTTRMVLLEWWRRYPTKRRCKWRSPCVGLGLRTFQTWPRILQIAAGTSLHRRSDRWSRPLQSFWQFRRTDRTPRAPHHHRACWTVTMRHLQQSRSHDHQRRSGTTRGAIAAASATGHLQLGSRHLQLGGRTGTTGTTMQTAIHRVIRHMSIAPVSTEGTGQKRDFHHPGSPTTKLRGSPRLHHRAIPEAGHIETPVALVAPPRHLQS